MPRLSLRLKLLAVLLPGVLLILVAELWLARIDAQEAADAAFDRSLSGAIRSVDLNISTASGGLAIELPYRLFEFFQLTAGSAVYFRVATSDGLVEIGSPDLPTPATLPAAGTMVFQDAEYFGEPVRVGTYVRALESANGSEPRDVVIQVAEGVASRRAFAGGFVLRSVLRDAAVLSLVGVSLAVLVTVALRPLARLAEAVGRRNVSDLRPLQDDRLPSDLQPLVRAVNQQLARTAALMERQRIFVDDASHQLRTSLATLHTQVGYGLRQGSAEEAAATLAAIADELVQATRGTNQLLALARVDAMEMSVERFDLGTLLREIATRLIPVARTRGLDLGVECERDCHVQGDRHQLGEAIGNLAHNAATFAQEGGRVTLSGECSDGGCEVVVSNTGEPLPEAVAARLGERFLKGASSRGAGLGLAIARSSIERHGGSLVHLPRVDGLTRLALRWPRKESPHDDQT